MEASLALASGSSFILFTFVCAGAAAAVATVAGSGPEVDHATQARRFVRAFRKSYGERHPRFVEAGFRTAVAQVCGGKLGEGADQPQLKVMPPHVVPASPCWPRNLIRPSLHSCPDDAFHFLYPKP